MTSLRNERGIALASAIFALVVIGALVSGAFFVGMQEQRIGYNTLKLQQAFAAADGGAQATAATWNAAVYNQLPVGDSVTFGGWLDDATGWYRGSVRRLNNLLYLIRSEGFSRDSSARQQVGLLIRLRPIEVDIRAGMKTQDSLKISGNGVVSGGDSIPPGWTGCLDSGLVAGVLTPDPDSVQITGGGTLDGKNPPLETDASINDSTMMTFGDATWDDLKMLASMWVPPTAGGAYSHIEPSINGSGQCDVSDLMNWGEPGTTVPQCQTYFPTIYVPGDLKITGGRGQGLLIVEGNLEIQGQFEYYGPVIVRGWLKTTGSPQNAPRLYGGVIIINEDGELSQVGGNASIFYSSCALVRSLMNSASAAPLQERSWVNLY